MEMNSAFVTKLKNDSVLESDREGPKLPKATVEFMGIKGGVKGIFSKSLLFFLSG